MEWVARQHLDIHLHAQCAAFHPRHPLFAVALRSSIVEYDILTGCKLSSVDMGGLVIRMAYSPAGGHVIVAVLEDLTIRSWDLDTEHTYILYSPPDIRKADRPAEVHIALTPLRRWLFFAAHRRSVVNVVGTVEGLRPAMKLKTDLKKPITGLACHPRQAILYVAYADGIIRGHSLESFAVVYVLAVEDISVKLAGAGAIAFHPTLLLMFVGDRTGSLIAWDVSVPTRPALVGFRSISSEAITAVQWHASLQVLLTLSRAGAVQGWRARVHQNAAYEGAGTHFFEQADLEQLDVARILSRDMNRRVGSTQRIKDFLLHPRLNVATLLFAKNSQTEEESGAENGSLSYESRKMLTAVLQAARGSAGASQKEKLASLGTAGLLSEQQLQQQLILHRGQSKITQPTAIDFARRAFLYGTTKQFKERGEAVQSLPLLAIADPIEPLHDLPVCEPFQADLRFFNSEQGIFDYPSRIILMDGCNLLSYTLAGAASPLTLLKKLPPITKAGAQRIPRHMVYSSKQQAFLIFFDCRGGPGEVIVYRYLDINEPYGEGLSTMAGLLGRDGCWTGKHESQFAVLEDDGYGLSIHNLENANVPEVPPEEKVVPNGVTQRDPLDENDFVNKNIFNYGQQFDEQTDGGEDDDKGGPVQFMFDTPVQRIFGTPLAGTLLYVSAGSHMGLVEAYSNEYGRPGGDLVDAGGAVVLNTKRRAGRHVKLQPLEVVLQVRWQEKPDGAVAGVMSTHRVMIVSARMEVLASSAATLDQGYPPFRSILWVGPSLFFSTATAVAMLGWDSVVRPLLTIDNSTAVIVGVLNDRVLLAQRCEGGEGGGGRAAGVEVRMRLLGLLEPLLLGWVTLLQAQGPDPAVDLHEITFQLTSRFDSQRTTPRLVETLSRGPPICSDLAVELAQSGPQFTQELRCLCAIRARKFEVALQILKDEFSRMPEYPRCPPNSRLFLRFRDLGNACIKYGQFDKAKEVFKSISDSESQFDLFLAHMNPSALRLLSQTLEESGEDSELRRQCEQVLLVRSAGWSQGSAFMALGGETLAPRGAEWGGGNWPLKTVPEESKPFPKWELAGTEITAYMRTPSGAIPVITPDSIGVYLGTEKGKGTVVEVQGVDSKKFGTGSADDPFGSGRKAKNLSPEDVDAAAVAAFLGGAEGAGPGKSKLQSMADEEAEDIEATEEQKRAEAEFKRGIVATGSDSDDDNSSPALSGKSKWALRIREKTPLDGAVRDSIDVKKIKDITSSFKIGELHKTGSTKVSSSASNTGAFPPITAPLPTSNTDGPPALFPPPVPFQPIWGPSPAEISQSTQRGGVPSQAVALGYAQPQYPPGAARPPPDPRLPQSGIPLGASQPVYPYTSQTPAQGFPTELSYSAGGAQVQGSSPFPPLSAGSQVFGEGAFVAQPGSSSGQVGPAPTQPSPPTTTPSTNPQADLQQGGLPPPYPSQTPLQALHSQDADLQGGVPPTGPPSEPSPSQDFGGLLSGSAAGQVGPIEGSQRRSASAGSSALPDDVVDLGPIMGRSLPPVVVSSSPSVDLGPLDALNIASEEEAVPAKVTAGHVPRGAAASLCFKAALIHIENNRLNDAQACLDEAFLALAKDRSVGKDIGQQAKICAQYKVAVLILQETLRLQKAEGQGAMGAKEELARLARHLASLPLQAKHRISCIRTAIKRNMEVQNWAYSKKQLDLLLSKAPPQKQAELRALANVCTQRGLTNRTINGDEDASQFCAQTLLKLPTIGHDSCDTCGSNFSAIASPGCPVCGMGIVRRSDARPGGYMSPF